MMELLDLDNLTEEERTIILNVIRRDDELRRRQENRISQVKQELHNLRMNSVLRQGDDLSKICARCKAPFGFITNTGEVCPVCRFRVCRNCRENLLTHGWMCILCFKENQLRWLSGDWMVKDKGKNHKPFSNGTDLVRASLRIKRSSARETDVQHVPRLNQPQQSDADRTGSSDQSDADPTSPAKRSNSSRSGTPQRSSHLSIPATVASSHTGSIDEKSLAEDDNIDELFAKHQMGSRLGFSRSSISDSRESLASVYSDAGEINYGRIPVSGEITFGLEYDHKLSVLKIHIKGCRDLAPVDTKHNRSDPYVKVYLLPDKTRSGKRKSKIKKHTLNPVYNETLTYNISQGELENRTLWVTVWHSDRFGRNDFLGEVTIPMDLYRFGDTTPKTYTLQSRMPDTMNESAMQYKGDLTISLMYVTPDQAGGGKKSKSKSKKSKAAAEALGEIHCLVKAANNLTAVRSNGTSDPFVKGYLLPDRGRTGKQKTPVVKNSVNPTWNHNLVFDSVDAMELADRSLELTVWDHEKLGTNEFLGGVRLNLGLGVVKEGLHVDWMDARGEESMAWQSMMEQPNTWIDAKLPLRASMGKASAKK